MIRAHSSSQARRAAIAWLVLIGACHRPSEPPVFTLLTPGETGVSFANTVVVGDSVNVQTDVYVYNGAGVGVGDIDIAAISFFPDYASDKPLSFVYLENIGGMHFRASTFPDADRGRWLTMDAGDVDGDGRVDLVLGSFAQMDTQGDRSGKARWHQPGAPAILILQNTSPKAGKR